MEESKLINFLTELTGESEGSARSLVMYLDLLEKDYFPGTPSESQTDNTSIVSDNSALSHLKEP